MRQKLKTVEPVDNRNGQERAKGWFIEAIVDTQAAVNALTEQMSPEDIEQSGVVLEQLVGVYRKQEYPLTVVLHAAGVLYAMALRMSLENMGTPEVEIN